MPSAILEQFAPRSTVLCALLQQAFAYQPGMHPWLLLAITPVEDTVTAATRSPSQKLLPFMVNAVVRCSSQAPIAVVCVVAAPSYKAKPNAGVNFVGASIVSVTYRACHTLPSAKYVRGRVVSLSMGHWRKSCILRILGGCCCVGREGLSFEASFCLTRVASLIW